MALRRLALLRLALAVTGVTCAFGFYPLVRFWHAGFGWGTHDSDLLPMMLGLYFVLGVFLIIASRDPLRHRSLIWFAVWSSAAHAAIMAVQTIGKPAEYGHWVGDIPALLIVAVVLGGLLPSERQISRAPRDVLARRRSPESPSAPRSATARAATSHLPSERTARSNARSDATPKG